jgi:hypothetical protein
MTWGVVRDVAFHSMNDLIRLSLSKLDMRALKKKLRYCLKATIISPKPRNIYAISLK